MAQRYLCIHGHFYQPPRENPWSGKIERQASAHPHHDWNERITEECYRPNAAARILDERGENARTISNYAKISFNFGPTLLGWLERHATDVYDSILEADREGREGPDGHGPALAQVYNHMIMPLANRRDRVCQVAWGVRDFEQRFGRGPEGMWLPETAVDLETLDVLAGAGVRFTILAPHQARRVRAAGREVWRDVNEQSLDATVAYEQALPSGRRIALFFYDGPASRGVAFEGLLEDGKRFADRLGRILPGDSGSPRLAHIATDGESYGHHHKFGEMALAFALDHLGSGDDMKLTHYAAFLAAHPPAHEVEIAEDTSWSCSHGVERWRADCGCGSSVGCDQSWRAPLREAFDWLRDRLAPLYEQRAARLVRDPWDARMDHVDVLLAPEDAGRERFLARHARRPLGAAERDELWKLLELQRHAMLMYTSCGWFFDDLARIETIQVLRYAGRAVDLARECLDHDAEPGLLKRLEPARSHRPGRGTGRDLYDRHVRQRLPADPDD
jgi:alpha-amylase/alpha-mannosidase (GH57 family)